MSEDEAAVERVARAILDARFWVGEWDNTTESERNIYRYLARAALAAAPDPGLVEALRNAIDWFDGYAKQHRAKTPPDHFKAEANERRRDELRAALTKAGVTL